jgi:hypothetical protein
MGRPRGGDETPLRMRMWDDADEVRTAQRARSNCSQCAFLFIGVPRACGHVAHAAADASRARAERRAGGCQRRCWRRNVAQPQRRVAGLGACSSRGADAGAPLALRRDVFSPLLTSPASTQASRARSADRTPYSQLVNAVRARARGRPKRAQSAMQRSHAFLSRCNAVRRAAGGPTTTSPRTPLTSQCRR